MSKTVVWNNCQESPKKASQPVLWASKRGRKSEVSKTNSETACRVHSLASPEIREKVNQVVLEEEKLLAKVENEERLLRATEVIKKLGISRTTLYRMIEKGTIPKPLHLGSKIIVWPLSQINALIANL